MKVAGTLGNVGVEGESVVIREIESHNDRLELGNPMSFTVPSVNSIK